MKRRGGAPVRKIKTFLHRLFAPQTKPTEGTKMLLFAAGIYLLLLIWAIVFKFSVISAIDINVKKSLGERFINGFHFFDYFYESNPWLVWRGFIIAILNILVFMPWGIYASFFYDKKRTVCFAFLFSFVVEFIQLFANFGVFSLEDIILNTLGGFLGILLYQKYICRISQSTTQKINQWTVRIGGSLSILAYISTTVAMILYFS